LTNSIPAPLQVLQNTRAEGSPRGILFLVLVIIIGALIAAFVFMLISTSTNTSKVVLDEQDKYSLYSNTVVRGLFTISTVRYANTELASCTQEQDYKRPVSMTLRFQAYNVPDSCEIFVNNKPLRSERRLEPDCRVSCDFQEFNRQFAIGDLDYRDSHLIKVCCDNICLQKRLESLCTIATS
jgi:hypothetical protein